MRSLVAVVLGLAMVAGMAARGEGPATAEAGEVAIKSGDKIAFLGDSITAMGMGPTGYCTLVTAGLKANGIEVTPIGAGVSGNTSDNMKGRQDTDVLAKKPEWMTLSCGVNDVNSAKWGVPLERFKTNVRGMVEKAQAAGIKVMILTASPNTEELESAKNQTVGQYNAFLRELATEKHCLLADVNAEFGKIIKEKKEQDSHSANPGHYTLSH